MAPNIRVLALIVTKFIKIQDNFISRNFNLWITIIKFEPYE